MIEAPNSESIFHLRNLRPTEALRRAEKPAYRVALVDSDKDFQESACMALSDHGFAVSGFSSGQALLAYFDQRGSAEAIVLDWKLADGMGLQLFENLRLRGIGAPIVFLTSMPAAAYENLALGRGAADFVDKARGVEIFAKRLQLIIEGARPGGERPNVIRHGSLTVRPDIMRAYWNDVDVGLTLTEFNIVHRLVKSPDDYISYRQIYDCVRHVGFVAGSGEDGFRTNVRTSVKRIRNKFKKLDPAFGEIQNYPAFGYRWRTPVNATAKSDRAA